MAEWFRSLLREVGAHALWDGIKAFSGGASVTALGWLASLVLENQVMIATVLFVGSTIGFFLMQRRPRLQPRSVTSDGEDTSSRLVTIERDLSSLRERFADSAKLQSIGRTSDKVRARLGDRWIEMTTDAWEYYSHQIEDHHREQIHERIRRRPSLFEWDKRTFVMIVDEKARIRMTIDDFIGEGNGLRGRACEAQRQIEASPHPTYKNLTDYQASPLAVAIGALPSPAYVDLAAIALSEREWAKRTFAFLDKETHGHAQGFISEAGMESATDLAKRISVRIDRLSEIKRIIGG